MSEENKIAELLKPRYLVIADYPGSKSSGVNIGDIITIPSDEWTYADEKETPCGEDYFDAFPKVFKSIEWWEYRKQKEIPDYLKFNEERMSIGSIDEDVEPDFHKVKKHWATSLDSHWRYSSKDNFISEWHNICYCYGAFLPATSTDYEQYTNHKTV